MDALDLPPMARQNKYALDPREDSLYRHLVCTQYEEMIENRDDKVSNGIIPEEHTFAKTLPSRPYLISLPISKKSFWQLEKLIDGCRLLIMRGQEECSLEILRRICRVVSLPVFEKKFISTFLGAVQSMLKSKSLGKTLAIRMLRKLLHISSRHKHFISIEIAKILTMQNMVNAAYTEMTSLLSDTKSDAFYFFGHLGILSAKKFMNQPDQTMYLGEAIRHLSCSLSASGDRGHRFASWLLRLCEFCSASPIVPIQRVEDAKKRIRLALEEFARTYSDFPSALDLLLRYLVSFTSETESIKQISIKLLKLDCSHESAMNELLRFVDLENSPSLTSQAFLFQWKRLEYEHGSFRQWNRLHLLLQKLSNEDITKLPIHPRTLRLAFLPLPSRSIDKQLHILKQQIASRLSSLKHLSLDAQNHGPSNFYFPGKKEPE